MITENIEWKGNPITLTWIESSSYESFNPIKQVSAVIFNDEGKILLIKMPHNKYWSLPGGTPEGDESEEEALRREIDEEADCDVDILGMLGAVKVDFPNNPCREQGELFYQLRYICKVKTLKKQSIDPAKGVILDRVFVSPEDFIKYLGWKESIASEILRLALERINND